MKNNIIIILSLILFLTSCGDFLEYKDKDQVIPNKLNHYEELIFGELLMQSSGAAMTNLALMTDDVEDYVWQELDNYSEDIRDKYYGWYTWAPEPQYDLRGGEQPDKAWEFFYHKILMCNIIENEVTALEDDMEGVKERLLGEVRFMRGLSYFYLVNMYGAPYESKTQATTAMGIPINKETGIYDKIYTRSSLLEVYTLIENDLLAAKENFKNGENKNSIYRPNLNVVNLFLSRLYLFEKRYEEAINAATDVIDHSGASIEPSTNMTSDIKFYNRNNSGILFTYGQGDQGPIYGEYYKDGRYIVSQELRMGYVSGDVRLASFFSSSYEGNTLYPKKTNGDNIYRRAFRIEEAYLNRAEAYIELSKAWQKGVDDINAIRQNRIENFQPRSITSQADARDYCRQERRLELCFEEFRWFDIRRWGLEITHRYKNFNNQEFYEEFKLTKNSPNYILSIPLDEQEINSVIERPARINCKIK